MLNLNRWPSDPNKPRKMLYVPHEWELAFEKAIVWLKVERGMCCDSHAIVAAVIEAAENGDLIDSVHTQARLGLEALRARSPDFATARAKLELLEEIA